MKICGCYPDEICDCVERRDCEKAGTMGHKFCGPCVHNPQLPKFMCGDCCKTDNLMEVLFHEEVMAELREKFPEDLE